MYKVHTVYKKEDVLKMQKLVGKRFQLTYRCISVLVEVLLLAISIWSAGSGRKFLGIPLTTASVILMIAVAVSLILVELRPYQATRQILKDKKDKVIKANY